ncbi:unnamed protein product [Absidia cylindrospora]
MGSSHSYMDPYLYQSMYDYGADSFDVMNKWRWFGMPRYYASPPYYSSPYYYPRQMTPYPSSYYCANYASMQRPYSYPLVNYRSPYSRLF